MPIDLNCSCGKKLKVKDELAGRRVKCPACGDALTVPAPAAEFDVVDDEPAPAPKSRKAEPPRGTSGRKAVRAAADDEEEEPPPRKPGRQSLDEDEDEDEEEERPRKKSGKKSRKGKRVSDKPFWKTPLGLILNGIGLILLGGGAIALYFFDEKGRFGIVIAGILCIGFGIGGVVTGLTGGSREEEED